MFYLEHCLLQRAFLRELLIIFGSIFFLTAEIEDAHLLVLFELWDIFFADYIACGDSQPSAQKIRVGNCIKKLHDRFRDELRRRRVPLKIDRAVRVLGHLSSVVIHDDLAHVLAARKALPVVTDREHQLVRDNAFLDEIERQSVGHLPHNESRRLVIRGLF